MRGEILNLGIVTSFLFQAHPVATVLGGLIVHPRDRAHDLIRHFRDFLRLDPRRAHRLCGPDLDTDGQPAVAVIPFYSGDLPERERASARCGS